MNSYPHQIRILNDIGQNKFLLIDSQERQTGVSTILYLYSINQMIEGKHVYIVLFNHDSMVFSHSKIVSYLRELDIVCEVNKKSIKTSNNGLIHFTTKLSSTVDCRNRRYDTIILDNCILNNNESLNRLIYEISKSLNIDGKMIFAVTGYIGNEIYLRDFTRHIVDTNIKDIYQFLNKQNYGVGKKRISGVHRSKWKQY